MSSVFDTSFQNSSTKLTLDYADAWVYTWGMKGDIMQTLKVNTEVLRVEMARANIGSSELAARAGVHRNTIANILKSEQADLASIGVVTCALNQALREGDYQEIGPFGLLMEAAVMA